jgi:hypothetical protein
MKHHYIYGSGLPGCLFDNGPHVAPTLDDAINGVLFPFTSGDGESSLSTREERRARRDLRVDGIHYFPADRRGELGASYVQVSREPGPCPESEDT